MKRNAASDVDGADECDSMLYNCFARFGEFAISATLGGKIENHRPGLHAFHHLCCYKDRSFFAGDDGGGDDDVMFGDDLSHQFALLGVESFVLRAGVSA